MARFDKGYVKLWRKTLDSDLDSNPVLWWIWTWFMRVAVWQETKVIWQGQQRVLPPGSVVYGVRELASKGVASRSTISRWVKYLNDTGRIRNEVGTQGCIATLLNWDVYSGAEDVDGTQPGQERDKSEPRPGHGQALNEEVQEEKKNTCGPAETGKAKTKTRRVSFRVEYSSEFEEIWKLYGRRGDKGESQEAFKELTPDERGTLIRAVRAYVAQNPEVKYRKHLQRFIKSDWRAHLEVAFNSSDQFSFTDSTQEAP